MKIVFLQDNGINESLALTEVSGLLRSRGHECELFIRRNESRFAGRFRKTLAAARPGMFVVPMDIWGEHTALALAAEARMAAPDAPVVFCGTYPMLFPEVVERPEVDTVVMGEAEFPLLEMADRIEAGRDWDDIPNVVVRRGGEVRSNPMRPLLEDLSALPPPDRALYYKYKYIRMMGAKRFTSGRGCPNACSFCYNARFRESFKGQHGYVRRKRVERVIEEIEAVRRMSVLTSVHFSDDLFTHDHEWVARFCAAFREAFGGGLPFTCNTAVHDVTPELLAGMRAAGCTGIAIGVETGNETLRRERLNKPYKDEQIVEVARWIKREGMFLTTFNMLALPYETLDNAFETVSFNRRLRADNVRVTFLVPVPRTRLVDDAVKDGLLDENYERGELKVMLPKIEAEKNRAFLTLYALFDFAVAAPALELAVRALLPFRVPGFLMFFLSLPRVNREKKFMNIKLLDGLRFFLHTALPQSRTKNFNNFIP